MLHVSAREGGGVSVCSIFFTIYYHYLIVAFRKMVNMDQAQHGVFGILMWRT